MMKVFASALAIAAGAAIASPAVADVAHEHNQVDDLIKLANENPTNADIRVRLGSLLIFNGNEAEGQAWIEEARKLDPTRTDLNNVGETVDQITVRGASGPDVWVCTLPNPQTYSKSGDYNAYSVATTSANAGDVTLSWFPEPSNLHPVIGQNLYRWYQGTFSMVGQSWLKHGFCALQNGGCGACMPAGGGCPPLLGPGCADPYSSSLNGSQGRLGPKHEVNPTTGVFPGTHARPSGSNANRGRLLVHEDDAVPSSSGAQYWVEGQYIHVEDSQITAQEASLNNVTHASTTMSSNTNRSLSNFSAQFQQEPAIFSWQRVDPSVVLELVEADGYFHVGGSVTDLGGGQWRYQYNIFNLDSNAGVDDVTVNFGGAGVAVSSPFFNHPEWHSGSLYSNTPWATGAARGGAGYNFTVQNKGVNDNRIRWATMYTFAFIADSEPTDGTISMNVPGVGVYDVAMPVPAGSACLGDFDGSGTVDSTDLAALLAAWGTPGGDLNGSGDTDSSDLAVLLAAWGPC